MFLYYYISVISIILAVFEEQYKHVSSLFLTLSQPLFSLFSHFPIAKQA